MKNLIFEITKHNRASIDIPLNFSRKFPIHSHNLIEIEKFKIVYEYDPSSSLNEGKYANYLIKYLTEKHTSNSTSCYVKLINNKN